MSSLRRSHRIKKLYHQNLHDSSNSDQENEELEEMDINLSEEEDRSCDEDESDLSDFIVRDEDEDEEDGDYEEESDSSYDSDEIALRCEVVHPTSPEDIFSGYLPLIISLRSSSLPS